MQTPFSRFLWITIIEHLVFLLPVFTILSITKQMEIQSAGILLVVFLGGTPLSAFIAWLIAKGSNGVNQGTAIAVTGVMPGQVAGLMLGGFTGFRLFGNIGGIFLAIILFLIGSWAGLMVGRWFANQVSVNSSNSSIE